MVMVFEWVICKPKNKFKNQGERTNHVFFSQKLANYGKNNAIQSGFSSYLTKLMLQVDDKNSIVI